MKIANAIRQHIKSRIQFPYSVSSIKSVIGPWIIIERGIGSYYLQFTIRSDILYIWKRVTPGSWLEPAAGISLADPGLFDKINRVIEETCTQ